MKITHVGPESQFVSFVAAEFEMAAAEASEYFVLQNDRGDRGSFGMHGPHVHLVSSRLRAIPGLVSAVRSSDMVIAHSMSGFAALAFALSRRRTTRFWSGWGYDYYGTDESSDDGLLGPLTLVLAQQFRRAAAQRRGLSSLRVRLGTGLVRRLVHRAAARTDLFSAPVPADLAIFRRHYPEFRGGYSQLNYASVSHSFSAGAGWTDVTNILVGNSATFSNNHIEIFERLVPLDLVGRRVVVPLSYGEPTYRDAVMERGEDMLGDAFMPLVDFMPLDEYLTLIGTCGVVIMNHRRQQAVGNICAAVYNGAHVFLDDGNPMLDLLRSLGAAVYSTSELETRGLPRISQSAEVTATNRHALESFWGADRVESNIRALIERAAR